MENSKIYQKPQQGFY